MLKNAMISFPVMWVTNLLKSIIIFTVIIGVLFIWYFVRCVVNNMWGLKRSRLITRANVKFICYHFDNKFFGIYKFYFIVFNLIFFLLLFFRYFILILIDSNVSGALLVFLELVVVDKNALPEMRDKFWLFAFHLAT